MKLKEILSSQKFWEIVFILLVFALFVDYFFLQMTDAKLNFMLGTFQAINRLIFRAG